ncbi:DUF2807 domain-containing protein [Muricauda sp. 2012CJ35-5]|uniref:DUF2807 domain-containing protein n=1 Tax=Flagellimonas spongiicola TaxID=2942208 RepID=A0ABT0PVS7_9FLAO|nr:head GIN domain-containing protein [Allomuricauda spongiicola]MCL6275472.1 DUF2807 domain-containing protein [Allomuricauda spongiicola]
METTKSRSFKLNTYTLSLSVFGLIALGIYAWNSLWVSEINLQLEPYNKLRVSGIANVHLVRGDSESARLVADENIVDKIEMQVIDNTLFINSDDSISGERKKDIYLTYTQLTEIRIENAATVMSKEIVQSDNILIQATGSSEVVLRIEADSLKLLMEHAANVKLAGSTKLFDLTLADHADIMAYHLNANKGIVKTKSSANGSGIARIAVKNSLFVRLEGTRVIYCKGNPDIDKKSVHSNKNLVLR